MTERDAHGLGADDDAQHGNRDANPDHPLGHDSLLRMDTWLQRYPYVGTSAVPNGTARKSRAKTPRSAWMTALLLCRAS